MRDPTDIGLKEEPPAGLGSECPYFQHAQKLSDHGELEAARDIFLRSVDVDFCNAYAWAGLAMVYAEMDEVEHAAEAARQAVRSDPETAEWYLVLSDFLITLERVEECESALRCAEKLEPKHPMVFFNRAVLLASQGKKEEAIEALKQACELEPALADFAINVEEFDPIREMEGFPQPLEAEGFDPSSPFADFKIDS